MRRAFVIAAAICAFTSCRQQRTYYSWGGYEQSVRLLTQAEGDLDVDAQIQQLSELVERTRQVNGGLLRGQRNGWLLGPYHPEAVAERDELRRRRAEAAAR